MITFRYAHHLMFMFVVYVVIYRRKIALGYSLLIKSDIWMITEELICEISYAQLIAVATKIKEINQCINIALLVLKRHIQTIATHAPYSYAQCL